MSAGAAVTVSDDESEDLVLVVLNIWGKSTRCGVMVPKDDLSFKSIRDEMMKDRIRVQRPFHFTLGAGGKALSSEQEENWSDWGVFRREGEVFRREGEESIGRNVISVFIKEGVSDKPAKGT